MCIPLPSKRSFGGSPAWGEYRATVTANGALRELLVEIELMAGMDGGPDAAASIAAALRESLGLTVPLRVVDAGYAAAVRNESAPLCDPLD